MIGFGLLKKILFGKPAPLPDVVTDREEYLPPDGLPMGSVILGRQGTGKTTALAGMVVDYFRKFKERAIFVLDWSGSITDSILKLILQRRDSDELVKRTVYDDMGNPEWVVPLPEFSEEYGGTYEDQVERVSGNLTKLEPELVKGAPFVAGLTFKEIVPRICSLLTAIKNEHGESWQITEAKKLLVDQGLIRRGLEKYGDEVPEAKWFLERVLLEIPRRERELRTYAFMAMLGTIESKPIRARMGYYRPGWTPRKAIRKGQLVLVDGSRLINQRNTQHYLFTQAYSLIMSEINKRRPGDPNDLPVALVMDEVYSLLSIPGMAEEVGMLSPLYRSRKLELYIVLQALSQLAPTLRKQIWSIGNIMSFGISNFDEAYEIAQQLFKYHSKEVKLPARSDMGQPIVEPDRGQYLNIANKLQRMDHRECIIRRYESEKLLDPYIRYIPKTKEHPNAPMELEVEELKEQLRKEHGVPVREATEIINKRKISMGPPPQI